MSQVAVYQRLRREGPPKCLIVNDLRNLGTGFAPTYHTRGSGNFVLLANQSNGLMICPFSTGSKATWRTPAFAMPLTRSRVVEVFQPAKLQRTSPSGSLLTMALPCSQTVCPSVSVLSTFNDLPCSKASLIS